VARNSLSDKKGWVAKMKKSLVVFLAPLLLLAAAGNAFAWGNAVHTWLADHTGVTSGYYNFQELYGATLPDQYNFLLDANGGFLALQAHTDVDPVIENAGTCRLKAVAFGFASHNDLTGADYTAHWGGQTTPGVGYVIAKAEILAPDLVPALAGILTSAGAGAPEAQAVAAYLSPTLAHLLVESAVDLRVKSDLDRAIGSRMLVAAQTRSPEVPGLMSAAYAEGLAAFSGMTLEEAQEYLVAVEHANRRDIIRYGLAYSGSQGKALRYMAGLGVAVASAYLNAATGYLYDVVVPPELAVQFLVAADAVVAADFADELRATLAYLREQMSGVETCRPGTK
jgi:hypothetical protein